MAPSLVGIFNRLLPFATPGTPLIQDLLHLVAICVLLYLAPQIQERLRRRAGPHGELLDNDRHVEFPAVDTEQEHPHVQGDVLGHDIPGMNHRPAGEDEVQVNNEIPEHPIHILANGQPGPAEPAIIPRERNVGAKKAKSLARKDQRRAYHEFMRSQGDAQRAKDAEGATEREAALAAEKERRRAAEAALKEEEAAERQQRREQQDLDRQEDLRRRELVVRLVREGLEQSRMCDLFNVDKQMGDDVDEEWIEQIVNASGLIGRKGEVMTMITGTGWVVRVTAEDMSNLYAAAVETQMGGTDGRVDYEEMGAVLETKLRGG